MELRFMRDQERWRRTARLFAEKEIAPVIPHMERTDLFPLELIRRMAAHGFLGIPIPKQWGGSGADFLSYITAVHEISKISATLGVIVSVHTSVGTLPILQYGSDEQRAHYVRKLASGAWLGAFALTEPHAGSDAAAIRTSAERAGGSYILRGSKLFITNAGVADTYLIFAITSPDKGAKGMTAFVVEKGMPGLEVGPKEKKMGLYGSNTCELVLDDLKVPASQRLGEEGQGFAIAKGSLDGGRIGIAAQALGIAQAVLSAVKNEANHGPATAAARILLGEASAGRSGLSLQRTPWLELAARVEAARLLVYHAAWRRQEGFPCTKEASMAKMFASDTAVAVATEAIRLAGPGGISKGLALERLFRDAKVTQIYEGTNEIHRIVIGNQLLKG